MEMNTNVNTNGSLLNPETLTTCNDCFSFDSGEHEQCPVCGSVNIEVINE